MEPFKILYIEHEPDREAMKQSMELVPAIVVMISNPIELEEKLKESHFDLIVTDAYFLSEGEEHTDEEDGNYLLDKVVDTVRQFDSYRVKIAVLTHYSPHLLRSKKEDLERVDYVWNKSATPQDFLRWQIARIKDEIHKRFPEHALYYQLTTFLSDSGEHHAQWRNELLTMLEKYRMRSGEMEQVEGAYIHIIKIAQDLDIGDKFQELFDAFKEAETFNIAGKPTAWGHLRHVLNVFWLGYYMLNVNLFDFEKIGAAIFPGHSFASKDELVRHINAAWFITAMLHDIGLLGGRMGDLLTRFNNLLAIYPHVNLTISEPKDLGNIASKVYDASNDVLSYFDEGLKNILTKNIYDVTRGIDHGILSALTVMSFFKDTMLSNHVVRAAAAAMFLHNIVRPKKGGATKQEGTYPTELEFRKYPLASLLLICDQIEVWDRQTGQESRLSEIALDCAELSSLRYNENLLEGVINYVPFRSIAPRAVEMEKITKKLQEIINMKTMPTLNAIKMSPDDGAKIQIKFIIDGRETIGCWSAY